MTIAKMMEAQWGQIVAKVWQDEAFWRLLLADPAAVLQGGKWSCKARRSKCVSGVPHGEGSKGR